MRQRPCGSPPSPRDYGGEPFLFNIVRATLRNENFRATVWTGREMQLTLMHIPPRGEIGAEMHENVDQFLCVVNGRARVYLGACQCDLREVACVEGEDAILLPAGTWHNVVNAGNAPLKLYSIYAPPEHPRGTVHPTKEDAGKAEH